MLPCCDNARRVESTPLLKSQVFDISNLWAIVYFPGVMGYSDNQ
jgi:hypothetical protein